MNYFGLFFTFMIPGIVLGLLGAFSLKESAEAKRQREAAARKKVKHQAQIQATRRKQSLYVSTMESPGSRAA